MGELATPPLPPAPESSPFSTSPIPKDVRDEFHVFFESRQEDLTQLLNFLGASDDMQRKNRSVWNIVTLLEDELVHLATMFSDDKTKNISTWLRVQMERPVCDIQSLTEVLRAASHLEEREEKILRIFRRCFVQQQSIRDSRVYERLMHTFLDDYHGTLPQQFLQHFRYSLMPTFNHKHRYGRSIAIIQSSGTGKSRMVWELHHYTPTLYICLRDPLSSGFPVSDASAVNYFRKGLQLDHKKAYALVCCFFSAWMETAEKSILASSSRMEDIFSDWNLLVKECGVWQADPNRGTRFDEAVESAKAKLDQWEEHSQDSTWLLQNIVAQPLRHLRDKLKSLKPVDDLSLPGSNPVPIFIVVDESVSLGNADKQKVIHQEWKRLFKDLDQEGLQEEDFQFWLVLLDTSSCIADLAPGQAMASSSREQIDTSIELWSEVALDLFAHHADRGISRPRDCLQLGNLKHYGRPLWQAYGDDILPFSTDKLFRGGLDLNDRTRVVTALSQRVCLDLVPVRTTDAANTIAVNAVSSNMRILAGLKDGVASTEVPSEPILAIAAWSFLTAPLQNRYSQCLETLGTELLHENRIDLKGNRGEFFARLLLTMARDATEECYADALFPPAALRSVKACTFESFVKSLVTPKPLSSELPSSHHGELWINFTHMIHYGQAIHTLSPTFLWICWRRGVALQCSHNQAGIDGIIPVYAGDLDEPFTNEAEQEKIVQTRMTFIAWQAKLRDRPTAAKQCFHGPTIADKPVRLGLMTILLEMGVSQIFKRDPEGKTLDPMRLTSEACSEGALCPASSLAHITTPCSASGA
ncbi:hypothetical protein IE53DRAFT_385207 [Violaceomyces palustris]|uniref:Uncharacterized protein n=1 Tax=Violaceomyces palustris TaxID=1673888 RepID=A0ACD0P2Q0_9BASI|nr:hypothetical protein IE53DRAFT_385207 [Violaceomyces palustris]